MQGLTLGTRLTDAIKHHHRAGIIHREVGLRCDQEPESLYGCRDVDANGLARLKSDFPKIGCLPIYGNGPQDIGEVILTKASGRREPFDVAAIDIDFYESTSALDLHLDRGGWLYPCASHLDHGRSCKVPKAQDLTAGFVHLNAADFSRCRDLLGCLRQGRRPGTNTTHE